MHVALLKVAIELLHRDPELQQQETRTAVNKFFRASGIIHDKTDFSAM